jgi:hypothetical protein
MKVGSPLEFAMTKGLLLGVACAGVLALGLASGPAANTGSVICTDAFAGTAYDVTVPVESGCDLSGAHVTHDVIVENDAGVFAEGLQVGRDLKLGDRTFLDLRGSTVGRDLTSSLDTELHLERTTISGDLRAFRPTTVQTGRNDFDTPGGPVSVGHDVEIEGSPTGEAFDGICDLSVGHDFRLVNRAVTFGVGIGDNCPPNGLPANTIGHDLVVTGNSGLANDFFSPFPLEVGGNHVGHDLVFTANSAVPGNYPEVADNVVGHDAICAGNDPPPAFEASDGPNIVGHRNTCG